jgi:hypothetical protein
MENQVEAALQPGDQPPDPQEKERAELFTDCVDEGRNYKSLGHYKVTQLRPNAE